jgi:pimeloyl-ACP methyl ester carboxylesterase
MAKYAYPLFACVILLMLWFGFKSYTDPIQAPRAIAELDAWEVNGDRQWVLIRGCDRRNPVLLFLHGGPGMPAMYTAHAFQRPLERDFVVVQWDQRGAGKSFHADLDPSTMTITQMLDDAEVVVERLRQEFGVEKVILVGHSHGTYLGALLAHQRPDLFHAYVGVGQLGDPGALRAVQDAIIRERLARRDETAPPIDGSNRESLLFEVGGELTKARSMWPLIQTGLLAPEYSFADALNVAKGPQFAAEHLRYDLPGGYAGPPADFDIPVFVIMGARDAVTPVAIARDWFEHIDAPSKSWSVVEGAAHFPHFEQPARFAELMRGIERDVLPNAVRHEAGAWPIPRLGLQCRV